MIDLTDLDASMEFARRDDCLDRMVPSDVRLMLSEIKRLRREIEERAENLGEPVR